ncbi:6192_t:CDS:2, partial [Cetraspora pellucida]
TGILPSVLSIDVDIVQDIYLELIEHEKSEICELLVDLSNSVVSQEIEAYRNINNTHIPMKEAFNDAQIVETQDDPDDSDEEPPKISASEGLDRLKNFILFAKQQISANQNMIINNRFFLNDLEFSNDNDGIPDNDYFFEFSDNYHSSSDDIITN